MFLGAKTRFDKSHTSTVEPGENSLHQLVVGPKPLRPFSTDLRMAHRNHWQPLVNVVGAAVT